MFAAARVHLLAFQLVYEATDVDRCFWTIAQTFIVASINSDFNIVSTYMRKYENITMQLSSLTALS